MEPMFIIEGTSFLLLGGYYRSFGMASPTDSGIASQPLAEWFRWTQLDSPSCRIASPADSGMAWRLLVKLSSCRREKYNSRLGRMPTKRELKTLVEFLLSIQSSLAGVLRWTQLDSPSCEKASPLKAGKLDACFHTEFIEVLSHDRLSNWSR